MPSDAVIMLERHNGPRWLCADDNNDRLLFSQNIFTHSITGNSKPTGHSSPVTSAGMSVHMVGYNGFSRDSNKQFKMETGHTPAWYSQWYCSLSEVVLEPQFERLSNRSDNVFC